MVSVALASFMCMVSSALSSSSLQQESIVAQVVSSHSRAMFICPATKAPPLAVWLDQPWGCWGCGMGKVLATPGIFSTVGGDGEWLA